MVWQTVRILHWHLLEVQQMKKDVEAGAPGATGVPVLPPVAQAS